MQIENAKLFEFNRIVKKFKELGLEKKIFEDFFILLKYLFGKKEGFKFYNNYLQVKNFIDHKFHFLYIAFE